MDGRKLQRALGLLGVVAVFVAAALPVQGIAATNPRLEAQPAASSSVLSKAIPDPGQSPRMPSRAGTQSKSLSPYALVAGGTWSWQNPLPDGNPLLAISCPSSSTCFAGSSDGRILATTNSGSTWSAQTTGVSTSINAISCASTTACVAVGDFGAAVSTSNGGAAWSKVTTNGGNFLAGVGCPTASICFAAGALGAILKSADGGATWVAQTSGTANHLFAVSCPVIANCVAVGGSGTITRSTDGLAWTVAGTGGNNLYGVSCLGSMYCMVVGQGGTVLTSTNPGCCYSPGNVGSLMTLVGVSCQDTGCSMTGVDGNVYFRMPLQGGTNPAHGSTGARGALYGISCPTAANCFAVGDYGTIVVTTSGGTGWTQQSGLPSNTLYGISCPSTTVCFAVGTTGEVAATANAGTTWSTQTSGNTQDLYSISCPSISTCFVAGNSGTVIATTNGGTTWSAQTSNTVQPFRAISCASTMACFAITTGSSFIKTTNGTTWSLPANIGAATGLTGISCPTATTCFATDPVFNVIYATTDGGATWPVSVTLGTAGIGSFLAVGCPSTTTCFAVGGLGLIATTSDSGAHWRTDDSSSQATLTGVSCPSAGTCYVSATDSTILRTTDYGGTWDVQMGLNAYNAVSCPSSTSCFAVGSGGNASATTNGGAAWSTQRPSGPTRRVKGMSCTSNSDCYAVALNTFLVTHNGGTTWAASTLGTTDLLDAISCPAANTCFAAGWPAAIYRTGDGGTTWTLQAHSLYGSDNTFLGVSCATTTTCVVVGNQGIILSTSNGTTWVAETSGTTQVLYGVSCPDTSTCVAVSNLGLTITRSGGSWQTNAAAAANNLRGVSCPSATACYAVGWAGTLVMTQDRGASWTPQTSGTIHDLYGVSCPRTTACLAVGNFGTVVFTVDGSSWAVVSTPTGNALRAAVFQDINHAWVGGLGGSILANPLITSLCASVSASASPPSPSLAGTQVTFTAIATGCPNKLYQFWMRAASQSDWQLLQAYSPSATYTWNSTGAAAGDVYFGVWAKDASSGTASFDANASIKYTVTTPPPCASVIASAVPASPSSAGTQVTFTATASGCGNPRYQFWMRAASQSDWQLLQAYSASNTYNWNSTGAAAGIVYFGVWAKDAGSSTSGFDANASIPYSVTTPSCASVTASAAPATVVHGSGIHVTVTGAASGCTNANPLYEFWLRTPTSDWQLVRAYSTTATYDWNTAGAPVTTVYIGVWAKDAKSSTSSFDPGANFLVTIPVT